MNHKFGLMSKTIENNFVNNTKVDNNHDQNYENNDNNSLQNIKDKELS